MLGTEFKSWAEINHDPVRMADRLALLCVAPGPEHSQANPHDAGYVKSYVNPLGAAMMRKRAGAFPVGSQVVKEKHDQTPTGEISVYTMMTKREKGFNPKGGDWEYAVYDGKGELKEKGKIARCMSCHQEAKAKERDFIFAEYADQAFLKGK
jgi:hypothetical protein